MGKSVLHQSAPSPGFAGYCPILGEECSASIAPSPACGGYFHINGEEFSSIRRALHLGRRAISGGGPGGAPTATAEHPRSRPSAPRPPSPAGTCSGRPTPSAAAL